MLETLETLETMGTLETSRPIGDDVHQTSLNPAPGSRRGAPYAPCALDPDGFFSIATRQEQFATKVCGACQLREACAEAGQHEEYGVWGGTTQIERAVKRRGLNLKSDAGYQPAASYLVRRLALDRYNIKRIVQYTGFPRALVEEFFPDIYIKKYTPRGTDVRGDAARARQELIISLVKSGKNREEIAEAIGVTPKNLRTIFSRWQISQKLEGQGGS